MVGGGGVVGVVPRLLGVWQMVGGAVTRAATVAGGDRGGGRDHTQGPVKS